MNRDELMGRFDLTDRVAIVTGGSRGIGRAIAVGFAAMGAKVVVASRKADACAETAATIIAAGGEAISVPTHVGRLDDLTALVEATKNAFGRIDVLVNNAANALAQPIGSITPEAWAKSYEANVRGPLFLVQEALPLLRDSPHPAVINVITAGVFTSGATLSLYVSGKAALFQLTRSMAAELAGSGVRVNALAPGTVDTDMTRNTGPESMKIMARASALGRIAAPEEMVPAALFLATEASSYMTGHVLIVDGGLSVH